MHFASKSWHSFIPGVLCVALGTRHCENIKKQICLSGPAEDSVPAKKHKKAVGRKQESTILGCTFRALHHRQLWAYVWPSTGSFKRNMTRLKNDHIGIDVEVSSRKCKTPSNVWKWSHLSTMDNTVWVCKFLSRIFNVTFLVRRKHRNLSWKPSCCHSYIIYEMSL